MDLDRPIKKFMDREPLFVSPEEDLRSVAMKMAKGNKDVVVVMTKEGELKGLITAGDLFYAMKTEVLGKDIQEGIHIDVRAEKVSEIMKSIQSSDFMMACGLSGTKPCISLSEDDTVANAIRLMAMAGIDHLLIIGENGVAGTLSDNDLIKAFLE